MNHSSDQIPNHGEREEKKSGKRKQQHWQRRPTNTKENLAHDKNSRKKIGDGKDARQTSN